MQTQTLQWPEVDEEVLRPLPPVLRAIVKALGFARASQLLDEHGGMPYKIPKHTSRALGLSSDELARVRITLANHMDAEGRVSLPKCDKLFKSVRDAEIVKNKGNKTVAQQVREYKLTSRHITNLRKALTKDERLRESAVSRQLAFSQDELNALASLAEEKLASSTGNVIYKKILNKLQRAASRVNTTTQRAQFDLFG